MPEITATSSGFVFASASKRPAWLQRTTASRRLEPGQVLKQPMTVPAREAQRLLRAVIRFVVDIPAGTSPVVVWEHDGSELWVDASTVTIACAEGLVQVGVTAGCDQLDQPAVLTVPIAVGTPERPAGLVMTTIERLDGPDLLVARWSEAVTAFAWEGLLELARRVCAEVGEDRAGLPLIPGAIAATRGALLIRPMSRHDLSALTRRSQ